MPRRNKPPVTHTIAITIIGETENPVVGVSLMVAVVVAMGVALGSGVGVARRVVITLGVGEGVTEVTQEQVGLEGHDAARQIPT